MDRLESNNTAQSVDSLCTKRLGVVNLDSPVWEQGTHALVESEMQVANNNGVTLDKEMDLFESIQVSVVEHVL